MSVYDPNSMDSRLSEILTRLKNQDEASSAYRQELKDFMLEMRDEFTIHRAKFEVIDREKWYQRGFVAAIALAISVLWAWLTSGPKP